MQGASPLASPGLNPSGTGEGGEPRTRWGGLPSLSPVTPAFSLLGCPHPPDRARRALFPSGEGGDQGYFMQGAKPLASPALNRLRHLQTLPPLYPAGGLPSLSPATSAFSFASAPIPPTPFPSGEGGDQGYFMQGASPLASPALNRLRHVQSLSCWCPEASLAGNRFLSVLRRTMGSATGMQGAKPLA